MVPIISRGNVMGLIGMETNNLNRRFGSDDLSLADQISLQVAVAVDVARLFEQTEHRAERERLMSEITAKVRASTNIDLILQTAIKELSQALQVPKGKIELRQGDGGQES
jgi:GAF domain-containing protein